MTSTNNAYNVTKRTIKSYFNDGHLDRTITTNDWPTLSMSFDNNGVLKILVAGKCPNCKACHL